MKKNFPTKARNPSFNLTAPQKYQVSVSGQRFAGEGGARGRVKADLKKASHSVGVLNELIVTNYYRREEFQQSGSPHFLF